MRPPTKPIATSKWFAQAAAEIELNRLEVAAAKGVLTKYGIDTYWVKDDMSNTQIVKYLWANCNIYRSFEKKP